MADEIGAYKTKVIKIRKELEKEASILGIGVFIPTWNQINVKILIWDHIVSKNMEVVPSSFTFQELEKLTKYAVTTWQKWKSQEGFLQYLDEKDDFQKQVDKGAYRVLKRLEELAFLEKSNAAVAACRAYLALSSFSHQRIEMSVDDVRDMPQRDLDKEIEMVQKLLNDKK